MTMRLTTIPFDEADFKEFCGSVLDFEPLPRQVEMARMLYYGLGIHSSIAAGKTTTTLAFQAWWAVRKFERRWNRNRS
jgi:hypothetical protein